MTEVNTSEKRSRSNGGKGNNRRNKKKRYRKYSNTVTRRDLGKGSRGFLISCTPKHEVQTFRDALFLLDCHVDVEALAASPPIPAVQDESSPPEGAPKEKSTVPVSAQAQAPEQGKKEYEGTTDDTTTAGNLTVSLNAELAALKAPKKDWIFEHVDVSMRGSVFVRVRDARINLESVVESILSAARAYGEPGCRFVQKIMPIHSTCYASPEDAAAASVAVVSEHFPQNAPKKYAIQFKARANTGAHRADYIKVIAEAILQKFGDKYTVDLTKPDVVLLVEVIKTSCCVGAFGPYFQLGKLNVREAAKPLKENAEKKIASVKVRHEADTGKKEKKTAVEDVKKEETTVDAVGDAEAKKEETTEDFVGAAEVKKEVNGKGKEEEAAVEADLGTNCFDGESKDVKSESAPST